MFSSISFKTRRIFLAILVLVLSSVACNLEDILNDAGASACDAAAAIHETTGAGGACNTKYQDALEPLGDALK